MPRVNPRPRQATYWWSEEIAELRQDATRLSRQVARQPKEEETEVAVIWEEYRAAREFLYKAIRDVKTKAWKDFLQAIKKNPWGDAYRLVINKL